MTKRRAMVERGIWTTRADIWIHLHPLDMKLYWYLIRHMRAYLKATKIAGTIGRSKDESETGNGVLVWKGEPFIKPVEVPSRFIGHFGSWSKSDMTDRQAGFNGQTVVDWLVSLGYAPIYPYRLEPLNKRAEQLGDFGDYALEFAPRPQIEIKTERVEGTQSLFVQTHEGGHRPQILSNASGIVTRLTPLPPLDN